VGGRAGPLGLGMLCLAASMPDGFDALDTNWRAAKTRSPPSTAAEWTPRCCASSGFEATKKSYELYARYVVPHFRRPNVNRAASLAWTFDNTEDFNAQRDRAAEAMFAKHAEERAAKSRAAD
jgi:hypothetical protein